MSNKEKVIGLLLATHRDGMDDLICAMEESGFFDAPCSGSYHLCQEGGLAEHSLNVYYALQGLDICLKAEIPEESMVICALLHDLGKAGDHAKPNYIENLLKSGKRSESKPFETNKDLLPVEHEIRSVIIAERWIALSEEEEFAILNHNGLYGKLNSGFSSQVDKTKLSFLLHTADMYVSRFVED